MQDCRQYKKIHSDTVHSVVEYTHITEIKILMLNIIYNIFSMYF